VAFYDALDCWLIKLTRSGYKETAAATLRFVQIFKYNVVMTICVGDEGLGNDCSHWRCKIRRIRAVFLSFHGEEMCCSKQIRADRMAPLAKSAELRV